MKTLITLLAVFSITISLAQTVPANNDDPFLPGKGKFNGSLLTTYTGTTPPPVLIADVTYGVTQKTSIGLVGGTIGTLALLGLKVNTELYQRDNFRIMFKLNVVYYPERNGTFMFDQSIKHVSPWMFTMGTFNAEWKTTNNVRWSVGMGMLESHCIQGMMNFLQGSNEGGNMMMEMFVTGYGGVSIPLSSRLTLRPEVVVVMKDFQLIEKNKYKFSPFNPFLTLTYTFGKR